MTETSKLKDPEVYKQEIKLKAIILLSEDGLPSGNKLGYNNFELYCMLRFALDVFIEDELYEMCAEIRDYMETDDMKEIAENFEHYSAQWKHMKKIF